MAATLKKKLAATAMAIAVMVAVVGLLHAPFARTLLMKIGGCPVGKASAADVDLVRKQALASVRGDMPAPLRPALGFVLGSTTPDAVQAWARTNQIRCEEKRDGLLLLCSAVPGVAAPERPAYGGPIDEISFAFRPGDRALVNLTASAFALSSGESAHRMSATVERLTGALGDPVAAGAIDARRFAAGGFATANAAYRFSDYIAEVTATSFGSRGVFVREHYVLVD
jgi:hypothetical protein